MTHAAVSEGHTNEDRRALADLALDVQCAPGERRALVHADYAEPAVVALAECGCRIESNPIVLDDHHDLAVAPLEQDVRARRPGMLEDVVQCLLRDSIEAGFNFLIETLVIQSSDVELGGDAVVVRPFPEEFAERAGQSDVVQAGRAKLPCEELDVGIQALRDAIGLLDAILQLRSGLGARFQTLQIQTERRHLLAEVIVEVARDASAFVFLDRHEALQQILDAVFAGAPLVDLQAERGVGVGQLTRSLGHSHLEVGACVPQRTFVSFAVGDVLRRSDCANGSSAGVPEHDGGASGPDVRRFCIAVGMHEALFEGELGS